MSDVREAAERLREYAELIVGSVTKTVEPNSTGYEVNNGPVHWGLMEPYELAAAYLAEHDETPIDEAWLRSVGFERDGRELCLFFKYDCCRASEIVVHSDYGWKVGGGSVNHQSLMTLHNIPKTRGDVRRLCSALGIELTGDAT
jgi:hypothetical protein